MTPRAAGWHHQRHARILRQHPEVRDLFGADPTTAIAVVLTAAGAIGFAAMLRDAPWAIVVVAGWAIGAIPAHALGVLIHECSHNLVARRTWINKGLAIVANLPLVAPAAISFRHEHLLHHKHLGDADGLDTQAPTESEARLVANIGWKKLLSFTFGRFFYKGRPGGKAALDRWAVGNLVASIAVDVAIVMLWGWKPFVFLTVAALAGFGPHPLGARRVSEHLTALTGQPTHSYYGPWNALSFFVGYHVEHHDFPAVPWRRLRKLKALAAEDYDTLFHVRSWTRLLIEYVTSPRYRVGHYVGREGPIADRVEELGSSYGNDGSLAAEQSGTRRVQRPPEQRPSSPRAA